MTSPTTTDPKIPIPPSLANLDLTSSEPNLKPTILTHHHLPQPTHKSLLQHLQSTSSIPTLNSLLTTTLHKHTTTNPPGAADWSSRVYALSLELLRSGTCAPSLPELMNEVTRRALEPASDEVGEEGGQQRGGGGGKNGGGALRGRGTIVLPNGSYGEDGLPDVRMPRVVVESGVRFLEDRVQGNVDIVDAEGDGDERAEEEE